MNAATIVLYKPDEERLIKNISAIKDQVDKIVFVDNDFYQNFSNLCETLSIKDKSIYISNSGNKGIAYALNRAVEFCHREGIDWLLTLDQDSIVPNNIIETYERYTSQDNVSIICCAINYNNQEIYGEFGTEFRFVNECITSASYIKIEDCCALGGFDEAMFIDRVDFEYCYRVTASGRRILQTRDIVLQHQLGNLCVKHIANTTIHIGGHSAFRKFYMAQNLVYCHRKHPQKESLFFCLIKEGQLIGKTLFFEGQKLSKLKAIIKGIHRGIKLPIAYDSWIAT